MNSTLTQNSNLSRTPPVVLVVDDDLFVHQVLRELLGMLGITAVHCAADGRKAITLLKGLQTPPDYLFCDIFMPDVDGIEFLAQLANLRYEGAVVIMSASASYVVDLAKDIACANGLRVLGTLVKPIHLPQLAAMLSQQA